MLTFEQIASLIALCETLQGDDRHALLSVKLTTNWRALKIVSEERTTTGIYGG